MNKVFVTVFLISILIGCDTTSSVAPLGEDYFIKFYGSLGDQDGVAVKSAPDGGFIIAGNSTQEFGGQSDFLLIKVDALGNQEWQETYDFNGTFSNDFLTDVIVDNNSFIILGTSVIGTDKKMVMMRLGDNGEIENKLIIKEQSNNSYQANGISVTASGDFLVTGPITDGDNNQYGKSFVALVNSGFSVTDSVSYPSASSLSGKETVFVKAIEVINSNSGELNYLAFGYKNSSLGPGLAAVQLDSDFGPPSLDPPTINYGNSKVVDVIKISDKEYKLLSTSVDSTFLINVEERPSGYKLAADQYVKSENFIQGVSLAFKSGNQFLISSNTNPENSDISSTSILESSISGGVNWERLFGTEISYTSGEVIVLIDGSVIYTGTAGFKGQKKCFLVKLKSNGKMKD